MYNLGGLLILRDCVQEIRRGKLNIATIMVLVNSV